MVRVGHKIVLLFVLLALAAVSCDSGSGASRRALSVYEDPPQLTPVDVGAPGTSPGDAYYFHADLRANPGGAVIGELFGTKTLVKPAEAGGNAEQRATQLFFTFNGRRDQIVVAGVPDYRADTPEFDANVPVLRAILGGTGKYLGVAGELTSTRNPDGSYRQDFTLLTSGV